MQSVCAAGGLRQHRIRLEEKHAFCKLLCYVALDSGVRVATPRKRSLLVASNRSLAARRAGFHL